MEVKNKEKKTLRKKKVDTHLNKQIVKLMQKEILLNK